jgi:Flp pilus assembly pilin Flp
MLKRFLPDEDETHSRAIEYAVIAAGISLAILLVPILRHYGV